ncbi:MAG: D-glycero-beta-D-manno-heptose-7-phosphate kinase [PVC group bacterium]|nr:D-glycero-beta-D-manno-heptose-7-phosphate kinase [PVC group bacterium]
MSIKQTRVKELLIDLKKTKVLIVGDLILDQFIWGDVSRISPEAPVPVVLVERESFMPGGAANVAYNVSAMGGRPGVSGVIGKDEWGKVLKSELSAKKVDTKGVVIDPARHTSLKTRIVARHQQVVRVDREELEGVNKKISSKIIQYFKRQINTIQAVIIEDYGKGVINPYLIKEIINIARKKNIIVTVDPKEEHFSYYRGVTCITPNQNEAGKAVGIKITDNKSLMLAGKKLLKKLNAKAVLITRGEHGMCLFEKGEKPMHIPTQAKEVFDVSGAGDTVIATFTLALASGATFLEAAHISNYAAGVVVEKFGTGTCSQKELIEKLD